MNKRKPFEVGEMVKVYFTAGGGEIARVVEAVNKDCLKLITHTGDVFAHPRQCVRLRKKPKEPNERVMLNVSTGSLCGALALKCGEGTLPVQACSGSLGEMGGMILLTELREGEIPLSRDELAKAWNETFRNSVVVNEAPDGAYYMEFIKALGFPGGK